MADEKPILEVVNTLFDDNLNPIRKISERTWFRNILYYIGEQYIDWVVSTNTFRRKPVHPFIPTPVSNIIKDHVKSMKALILNKEFTVRVWPNSNEIEDKAAAEVGGKLLRSMDAENEEEFKDEIDKLATWLILVGTIFMRTFPMLDKDQFGISGAGKVTEKGDVISETIMPFNVYPDFLGDSLRKKRYVGIKSLKPKEWVEDIFKVKVSSNADVRLLNYEQRLMKMVGEVSPWKGSGLQSQITNMETEDLCIFKEVEFRPTKKYPKGRYVVVVDDQTLVDMKNLPIENKDGDNWFYTLEDFHYDYVPGRFWSDAGVNDLISPQNSINAIDQALELNRKGIGRPMVLLEGGIDIKRETAWGQSILVLSYDRNLYQKPVIERGVALPEQVLKERDIHKTTSQDVGGDPKGVLKGQMPTKGASGVLFDIAKEATESSHQPDVMRFYRALKRVYKRRLILANNLFTEQRMLKIQGKGSEVSIMAFKASDLRNNTDVRLELDSGTSSTKAGQTQMIMNLVEAGMFGDLRADPETRQEILRRLGLGGFKDRINVDVERAEAENLKIANDQIDGIFLTMAPEEGAEPVVVNKDPYFKYDNHPIHYEVHRRSILSKEFETYTERARTVLIAHTDIHNMLVQAAMMQGMEQVGTEEEVDQTGTQGPGQQSGAGPVQGGTVAP